MIINSKKTDGINYIPVKPLAGQKSKASGKSSIILYPGYNQVHDGDFDIVLPIIQAAIDSGEIEIITDTVEEKEVKLGPGKNAKTVKVSTGAPKEFKELSTKEKNKILKDTNDPATLEKWLDSCENAADRLLVIKRQTQIKKEIERYENRDKGKN